VKVFARAEAAPRAQVEPKAVIEQAVNMAHQDLDPTIRLEIASTDAPAVVGSELGLSQVLINLLSNATHAIQDRRKKEGSSAQGTIRISTGAQGGFVVIEVSDTGGGISPENLPRIFDPFFTTKPIGDGTGFGLCICHGIVTKLGGQLLAESKVGVGTTLRVLLPISAGDDQAPASAAHSSRSADAGQVASAPSVP